MKKMNLFNRTMLLAAALLMTGGLYATTNFYAWDMTTERPLSGSNTQGISCGNLTFEEKDITVELWLNISTENFVNGATVFSSRHNGDHGLSLDVSSDGRLRGFFKNDTNADKLNGRTDNVFPFFFEKNDIADKWVHIAIVFSSTNNISRSYLNGEVYQDLVKNTDPYTPYSIEWLGNIKTDGNNVGGFRLGYWYNNAVNLLYAKIADLRIWSVGRTDEEIKANYNKNLSGTAEDNPGLYLNYRFYTYERGFINDASLEITTNKGWCNPEAGWNTYYTRETLSAFPQNLAVADELLSWNTSEGEWEVSVFKSEDDAQVFTDTVNTNSISLQNIDELEANTAYYAKVRTLNNGFWSGQVTSETFTVTKTITGFAATEKEPAISVSNGLLVIHAENSRILNIHTLTGQLVRRINIVAGKNTVSNLPKGIYLVGKQKIAII
jgi:hypothetical protein